MRADDAEAIARIILQTRCLSDTTIDECKLSNRIVWSNALQEATAILSYLASRREAAEPSSLYQAAEERICECGAVGSGEGHTDWCPWQDSEWRKWGDAFNSVAYENVAPMTDDQIKHMVDRFLMWRLPEHFNPDCGISFDPKYRSQHGPVGTNLLDATQATAMVRHMIDGLPIASRREAEPELYQYELEDGSIEYFRAVFGEILSSNGVRVVRVVRRTPLPAPAGDVRAFDECVATGRSCEYEPLGQNGESQCRYCGELELSAGSAPAGEVERLRGALDRFDGRVKKYITQLNATGQADVAHLLQRDVDCLVAALNGGRDDDDPGYTQYTGYRP